MMNGPTLRDIHLPAAGWWPPAPGWWLLVGVVVLACAIIVAWRIRRRRRGPLRAALQEIEAMAAAFAGGGQATQVVDGGSRLMRRVARRVEPGVASRSGETWREFVNRHARDATTRGVLDQLAEARFRAQPEIDVPALLEALRAWCRDALRGNAATPFRGKGVAPMARGNDVRDAEAIPLDRAARAFAALRPAFRRRLQAPLESEGVVDARNEAASK